MTETVDAVSTQVREVFVQVFGIRADDVAADASPDTVSAWDSAAHISLMIAIEEACGTTFEPSELMELRTFGAIVERVRMSQR